MNALTPAHKKFLLDILSSEVLFLLVGGYAVNYHGYPRYTQDLDIWLKPDNDNKKHFISFLKQQKFDSAGINKVVELNFTEAQSFHIGENETRIDFMTSISGVRFEEAFQGHDKLVLEDQEIPVIQFQDLVVNKMISGRPQDKADVDMLQKIQQYRNRK